MSSPRFPVYYIPHGGGPCFFIKPEDMPPGMPRGVWNPMADYLRGIDAAISQRPKAVIVVTAHWMTPRPTFGNAATHELLYDYYGFPDYTYQFDYPAKGAPDIARRAAELLEAAGIPADLDDTRGIDHGVFVPFMLIYPDADVPIIPMSLQENLDAQQHRLIGEALAPLRDEDILIVGSGMSFHNMRALMTGSLDSTAADFTTWLSDAAQSPQQDRDAALDHWLDAPGARASHPVGGEEHLLPLMVAAGAGGDDSGRETFTGMIGPTGVSGFTFG